MDPDELQIMSVITSLSAMILGILCSVADKKYNNNNNQSPHQLTGEYATSPNGNPDFSKTGVVFVFDNSGSMRGAPIEEAKTAFNQVLNAYSQYDTNNLYVGLVAFSDERAKTLQEMELYNPSNLKSRIQELNPDSQTPLSRAIVRAEQLLDSNLKDSMNSVGFKYIIAFTDGANNVGPSLEKTITSMQLYNRNDTPTTISIINFGNAADPVTITSDSTTQVTYYNAHNAETLAEKILKASEPLLERLD